MNERIILQTDSITMHHPYETIADIYAQTVFGDSTVKTDKVRKFRGNLSGHIATVKYEGDEQIVYEKLGKELSLTKTEFYSIYTEIKEHDFWVNIYEGGTFGRFDSEEEARHFSKAQTGLGKYIRTQKFTVEI